MDKDTITTHVESMIAKAEKDHDSANALRFSQAACNAANALVVLLSIPKDSGA